MTDTDQEQATSTTPTVNPFPITFEVLKRKRVRVDDKHGSGNPNYKYRLKPNYSGWNPFWTNQIEEDILQPGDKLTLTRGTAQSTFKDDIVTKDQEPEDVKDIIVTEPDALVEDMTVDELDEELTRVRTEALKVNGTDETLGYFREVLNAEASNEERAGAMTAIQDHIDMLESQTETTTSNEEDEQ